MYEIINKPAGEAEDKHLKKSMIYDFENKCFLVKNGSPVLSDDENLLIDQWLHWLILTVPTKYQMYTNKFGIDTDSIIGGKIADKTLFIARIEEGIRANLDKCPVISDILNFRATQKVNELIIYFEVITINNNRKGVELSI